MKKSLFFVAAATLVLASCNNDVKIDENVALEGSNAQQEIAISPYAQKAKHAKTTTGAIESSTFTNGLDMEVAAYAFSNPADATWDDGVYFAQTTFAGTGDVWVASPKKYWPLTDAYLSFLAIAGVDNGDISLDIDGSSTAVYDGDSWTAQTDLMYAAQQEHVEKIGNAIKFPDDVDMTFQHALALLKFNVRVPNAATYNDKIAVTKIVVNDGIKTGTLTVEYSNYNAVAVPSLTHTWGTFGSATAAEVPSSAKAAPLKNDGTYDACGSVLLVPKASPATSFTSFTIYYTIDGNAFTFNYTPASTVLAQATKYIYNITFTLHEIIIDPEVEEWTDGGTEFVDIPTEAYAHNPEAANTGDFPKAGTIPATAGTYSFQVTGLQSTDDVTVTNTGSTLTSISKVYDTTNKIVTVTFKVPANATASPVNYEIVVTDSGTSGSAKTTTITVKQAAGA